jgi:hypothetical protein
VTVGVIYKYPLEITDTQLIAMPAGAEAISVAEVRGQLVLYALVNPERKLRPYPVLVYGTGGPVEHADEYRFVGTVVTRGGQFVWHVFVSDGNGE